MNIYEIQQKSLMKKLNKRNYIKTKDEGKKNWKIRKTICFQV